MQMNLEFSKIHFRALRDRLRSEDPNIDEQVLADTIEGLTDLHEIIIAIMRSALDDESRIAALKCRIIDMQARLVRFQERASKRRQIARDVMTELGLKNILAPDFTISLRPGIPALVVVNEDAVPGNYWISGEPRLNRQKVTNELKEGADIEGVMLSNPAPVLSVRVR
jgi:hypothetical protein